MRTVDYFSKYITLVRCSGGQQSEQTVRTPKRQRNEVNETKSKSEEKTRKQRVKSSVRKLSREDGRKEEQLDQIHRWRLAD